MPISTPTTILLIGCGRMGSALVKGWVKGFDASHIVLVDPRPDPSLFEIAGGLRHYKTLAELPAEFRPTVVLLAVKPQIMEEVLAQIPAFITKSSPVFISVAAGRTLDYFSKHLGKSAAVIRAMPNTPALIGSGITVLCAGASANEDQKHTAAMLMKAVGNVVWLEDEEKMNAVTALSGSGPAYVFYFLDALIAAAVKLGLPETLARQLAIETVAGSAALALAENNTSLAALRQNVVSPGGTTEAALKQLMSEDKFLIMIAETLRAGAERSAELSS